MTYVTDWGALVSIQVSVTTYAFDVVYRKVKEVYDRIQYVLECPICRRSVH
jgi:hypothetical protein